MLWQRLIGMLRADPPSPVTPPAPPAIETVHFLDVFWSDKHGIFLQGWVHCHHRPVRRVTLWHGDVSYEAELKPRRDLLNFYPDLPDADHTGFGGYLEGPPGGAIRIEVHTDEGSVSFVPDFPKHGLLDQPWGEDLLVVLNEFTDAFKFFIDACNDHKTVVAEIGARVVGEESNRKIKYFPFCGKFIGIDIHPGPGVDLVGDSHRLDDLVGRKGIDAVLSFSVLEHLSHPWLLAAATNRALTIGGLVFHSAPQTWPLHEQPNDFWRFSDEGLKILFGPEMGFEVLAAGMVNRMDIYPEERRGAFALVPINPGWGNAFILARKVRDIEEGAVAWPIQDTHSEEIAKAYPHRESPKEKR